MGRKQGGDSSERSRPRSRPGRRRQPPWGNLLGGKPIERQVWNFNQKIDRSSDDIALEQYLKMLRVKNYYGITGGDHPYPIVGLVAPEWLPWYNLSLRLASELDDSLTIIDAPRSAKTAPRWRGLDGRVLVTLVDTLKETRPKRSIRWCLREIQKHNSDLARHSLKQLSSRYNEAKHHVDGTKQVRKTKRAS
jgi:hypothetical protein